MANEGESCMGMFSLCLVDADWLPRAIEQVCLPGGKTGWEDLEAAWAEQGFRIRWGDDLGGGVPDAPWKMEFAALRKFWMRYALVVFKKGEVRCCCPMMCQFGHCVHKYVVEELVGVRRESSSSSSTSTEDLAGESGDEKILAALGKPAQAAKVPAQQRGSKRNRPNN